MIKKPATPARLQGRTFMRAGTIAAAALFTSIGAMGCAAQPADTIVETESIGSTSAAVGEGGSSGSLLRGIGGQCLDVKWGNSAAGTPVWMWPCWNNAAQQWRLTETGEIRIPSLGDKCLTASPTPFNSAWIGNCTGYPNQKWYLKQDGTIRWNNPDEPLCLDVAYAGTTAGTRVGITGCNGNAAQVWNFAAWSSVITAGQRIPYGQGLRSLNGRYRAIMQANCDFVVFDGTTPIFVSKTAGHGSACYAELETNGNFTIWDQPPGYPRRAVYVTQTAGFSGKALKLGMQDDGNLVLYVNDSLQYSNWALWSSKEGRLDNPPACEGWKYVGDCGCVADGTVSGQWMCSDYNTCTGERRLTNYGPCPRS
jgi:hypothetical protein